jgi:hypothetical protein
MTVGTIPKDAHVMIIGAMKCGTSSLYNYMIEHPQICPCVIKEPEFFSENQVHGYDEKNRKVKERVTRYDDLWDFDPARHRYALEASTGYTKYPDEADVPQTIHDAGIVPRFIYMVRNPFDRIESQYNFEKVLPGFHRTVSLASDRFLNYSNYFLQLTQYRRHFASERFLILDFDEMTQAPEVTLRKVYAFLKMEAYIPASFSVFNETKLVSDLEVAVLHNRQIMALSGFLPKSVRTFGRQWLKGFSRRTKKRRLTQAERNQIFERLKGDMRRFHEEYGVDVRRWGFHG